MPSCTKPICTMPSCTTPKHSEEVEKPKAPTRKGSYGCPSTVKTQKCTTPDGRPSAKRSIEVITRGRSEVQCTPAFPWIASEPFTTILFPAVGDWLDCMDVASACSSCKPIEEGFRNRHGQRVMRHVTESLCHADADSVDLTAVQSLLLQSGMEVETVRVAENLPNCRVVYWNVEGINASVEPGAYVESAAFSVQGIDELYLRFYPRGKDHSRPGFCSLYVGSNGTERDVSLRLKINGETHILTQRLNGNYVDGFVNFCDLSSTDLTKGIRVGLEVVCGENDDMEKMKMELAPRWATWTIPRMTQEYMKEFTTGDRISSDIFSVDGLGDDACFVLYPKGDTVDALSKVGGFVNVGLFGSADDKNVSFRMSAGGVSKVLTTCAKRYKSKSTGATKSCGEFFDACFGMLDEMMDSSRDELRLTLEVLDTQAVHDMVAREGHITWTIRDMEHLVSSLSNSDFLHCRYFSIHPKNVCNGFFSMGLRFAADGSIDFALTKVGQMSSSTNRDTVMVRISTDDAEEEQLLCCEWTGVCDTREASFFGPRSKLRCPLKSLKVECWLLY